MPLLVQEATMDLEMGITRQRERGSVGAELRGFKAEGWEHAPGHVWELERLRQSRPA